MTRRLAICVSFLLAYAALSNAAPPYHSADTNGDSQIGLTELLRVIQFYNSGGLHCQAGTEDGYAPAPGPQDCNAHNADYQPHDWKIGLTELLRIIQFYNIGAYNFCPGETTEDGFCAGPGSGGEGEGEGEGPVSFDDANLESAVREAIGKPVGDILQADLVGVGFTELDASLRGISDISGLEFCLDLETLDLHGNCIADISPLVHLTKLRSLNLHNNEIQDITPLASLENLEALWLGRNLIANVAPLVANSGLNGSNAEQRWDRINLVFNPIDSQEALADLDALEARGAFVWRPVAAASSEKSAIRSEYSARIGLRFDHGCVTLTRLDVFPGTTPPRKFVSSPGGMLRVRDVNRVEHVAPVSLAHIQTACGADSPDGEPVGACEVRAFLETSVTVPVTGDVTQIVYIESDTGEKTILYDAPAAAKGVEPCVPAEMAGDPVPISAKLIHGDPHVPDSRAFVILVMGDAFPLDQLGDPNETLAPYDGHYIPYSRAIADSWNFILAAEPFAEYADFIKVYRVDLISKDDRPTDLRTDPPTIRDTALRMERKAVGFDYDQALAARVASNTGIAWDKIVLLPNGDGSGTQSADFIVYSNFAPSRKMTALHECGHGIGGLADEYEYRHGTNPPESYPPDLVIEPNAIAWNDTIPPFDQIPWRHWFAPGSQGDCSPSFLSELVDFNCYTSDMLECQCGAPPLLPEDCVPLPTCEPDGDYVAPDGKLYGRSIWPEPGEWPSVVGLFEGAKYRRKGAYRPELRCRMRSDDDVEPGLQETVRFCTVCRENLVAEIVAQSGCVAQASPETDLPIIYNVDDSPLPFQITLHTPASMDHAFEISDWSVDGLEQAATSGPAFSLDPAALTPGIDHTVSVTVHDATAWVHPENTAAQAQITQTLTWVLTPEN